MFFKPISERILNIISLIDSDCVIDKPFRFKPCENIGYQISLFSYFSFNSSSCNKTIASSSFFKISIFKESIEDNPPGSFTRRKMTYFDFEVKTLELLENSLYMFLHNQLPKTSLLSLQCLFYKKTHCL